jgi:hypothetical protein
MAEPKEVSSPTLQPHARSLPDGNPTSAVEARPREPKAPSKRRPAELIAQAKEQLHGLIGYNVDSVARFAKADGGWHLSVTVVELHRIPAATDVLASYEVDLDDIGNIVSYHRSRRYFRDQVGDDA